MTRKMTREARMQREFFLRDIDPVLGNAIGIFLPEIHILKI